MEPIVMFEADSRTLEWLENVLRTAREQGNRVRFMTGSTMDETYLKVKVGGGMWTPPFYGNDDPYADNRHSTVPIGTGYKP